MASFQNNLDRYTAASRSRRADCGNESAMILDVIQQLKEGGDMGIVIVVAHNYAQIFDVCGRINLVKGGTVVFDKLTSETSFRS